MLNRRQFLGVLGAAASWPAAGPQAPPIHEWGSPVFDLHFHIRSQAAATIMHLDGAGITSANLLTRAAGRDQVRALQAAAPTRFTWFCSADPSSPEGIDALTESVKSGARGFGEMKYHLGTDAPEFRRVYALAAEIRVPILIHFQEVDHFENEGAWSPGFAKSFERMLKSHPQTTFIGHADAFWANVSAAYHNEAAYPSGPVIRGGITDKLLGDYPNLYGDLSANSGNNMLSRDPAFTADFLRVIGTSCSSAAIAVAPMATAAA